MEAHECVLVQLLPGLSVWNLNMPPGDLNFICPNFLLFRSLGKTLILTPLQLSTFLRLFLSKIESTYLFIHWKMFTGHLPEAKLWNFSYLKIYNQVSKYQYIFNYYHSHQIIKFLCEPESFLPSNILHTFISFLSIDYYCLILYI